MAYPAAVGHWPEDGGLGGSLRSRSSSQRITGAPVEVGFAELCWEHWPPAGYDALSRQPPYLTLAWRHQPRFVGQDHRVDAIAQVQLRQDPRHVGLDSRLAERQALG